MTKAEFNRKKKEIINKMEQIGITPNVAKESLRNALQKCYKQVAFKILSGVKNKL